MGLGKVPAFTLRHSVGAEKGKGAGVSGLLGLCTSCASRMKALSGRASKTDWWMVVFCAGMLAAIGGLRPVGWGDIACLAVKEGSNVELLPLLFRAKLASRYAKLASRYVWLASCSRFICFSAPLAHHG